jgi:hypothetical protein
MGRRLDQDDPCTVAPDAGRPGEVLGEPSNAHQILIEESDLAVARVGDDDPLRAGGDADRMDEFSLG